MTGIGEATRAEVARPQPSASAIAPVSEPDGRWLARHRYLALAVVVTLLTAIQTANRQWSTDMWEHVAVVRGLIDDPFRVTHPLGLLDTPYTVTLGLFGRVFGASAITMLSIAAVANVVLLLVGLRLFVIEATQNHRAPFWALVFVLLLWGLSPYRFSGFFDMNSIGFVVPYPSAFATGIALLTLTAALRAMRDRSWRLFAAVTLGTSTVVLVHPITGSWLVVGFVAVGISRARSPRDCVWPFAAGVVGFSVTLLWPYYSVFDLLRDTSSYDAANKAMYSGVVQRLFPAALGAWVIWRRLRSDKRDLLAVMLVGGLALYAYGYVRNEYSYGRSLAFIVLILDVAAADGVARLEPRFRWRGSDPLLRIGAVGLAALLLLGVVESRGGLIRMVPSRLLPRSVRASRELVRVDDEYAFLGHYVDGRQVVIGATKQDNRVIPAIAGQPLRPFWMAPVVRDIAARASAETEFLDPATTAARRAEIQRRYDARFVLVHKRDRTTAPLVRQLEESGARVVYDGHGFQLLELAPPAPL